MQSPFILQKIFIYYIIVLIKIRNYKIKLCFKWRFHYGFKRINYNTNQRKIKK